MGTLQLRPSNAHRWMNCAGSAQAEANYPYTTSEYADEGTAAHFLSAICLESETVARMYAKRAIEVSDSDAQFLPEGAKPTGRVFHIDEAMADAVQQYVDYVRETPGDLLVEVSLDMSNYIPEREGTSDAVKLDWSREHATLFDLKFGQGVRVDATCNEQGLCYALGLIDSYGFLGDIKNFTFVIHQPRLDHISTFDFTKEELMDFGDRLKSRVEAAHSEKPEFNPGETQCKFCAHKANCKALAGYVRGTVSGEFDDLTDPMEPYTPEDLDISTLAILLTRIGLIKDWANAINARATQEALAGVTIPGYKLVEGRSTRKWHEEDAVQAMFKKKRLKIDDFMPRSLRSVAQMEKHVGKKKFNDEYRGLVVKTPGRPTLAPESDKRQAIDLAAVDGFDDLTGAA